ncbi:MAG: hypothetical protein NVSMB18_22460 [Acetobacteraceae bacterium]
MSTPAWVGDLPSAVRELVQGRTRSGAIAALGHLCLTGSWGRDTYSPALDALASLIQSEPGLLRPEPRDPDDVVRMASASDRITHRLARAMPRKTRRAMIGTPDQPIIPPHLFMQMVSGEVIMTWQLKWAAKEFLLRLVLRSNCAGSRTIRVQTVTLAREMGVTPRTIRNYRADCVRAGYLLHRVINNHAVEYTLVDTVFPPPRPATLPVKPAKARTQAYPQTYPQSNDWRRSLPLTVGGRGRKNETPFKYKEDKNEAHQGSQVVASGY